MSPERTHVQKPLTRVERIILAHQRVEDALMVVDRLDVEDPRFEGALAEYEEAIAYRARAELVTYH